jgi:xanthine dehydrogenase molybdenum-binding subunit
MAAEDLKSKVFEIVAPALEVSPEDLDVGDNKVFSKTDPAKSLTWHEASALCASFYGNAVTLGWGYHKIDRSIQDTCSRPSHMYEVAVDTETGEVEVLNMLSSWDIGQALNPAICETQNTCAAHIGFGYAMTEDVVLDAATGFSLNANHYMDYKLATILDLPNIELMFKDDEPNPCTPHGQRGIGEPPIGGYVGINNAVYNAIGVSSNSQPLTPDKILKLLGKV